MKKFTLLIAMLVCAVGFGQNLQNISFDGPVAKVAETTVKTQVIPEIEFSGENEISLAQGNFTQPTGSSSSALLAPCNQEHPLSGVAGGGTGSSVDSAFKSAADIVVATGENFVLETIDATFLTFAPNDPPTTANIVYYEDAAGLPGTMIGSETVVPTIVSSGPWANPIADQYVTTMTVTPFMFNGDPAADTKYWIEISMGTATNQATVFWEYTEDTPVEGEAYAQIDAGVGTWAIVDPIREVSYNFGGQCDPIAGGGPCMQEHPLSGVAGGGTGSSVDSAFKSASDIVVTAGENFTIENIDATFLTFAPNDPPTTANIVYYEDAAGLPGTMIGSETVVPTIVSSGPWANPIADQYVTTMAVTPFTFNGDAGSDTTYWIEISMGTATNQATVFWEYTEDTPVEGEAYAQIDAGVGTWAIVDPIREVVYNYSGTCDPIGGGVCTSMTYDATGLPLDIDGAATSTADCAGAPNLVPIMVAEVGTIGVDADFENLTINITHTFTADLDIFLVAPTGEEIELTTDNGGGGDNFTDTVFEDGGADITAGSAPFTGTFQPEGGTFAAAFAGVSITGEWNLRLCDDAGGDTGTIDSVSMNLCVPEQPLTNNECGGATPVACDDVVVGDTSDNTDNGGNNAAPDEWYSFTGTGAPQFVTVSLCDGGTTYDSRLTVFDECGGTIIATNDDSCGLQSELSFVSDGTSTYYIAIEGFGAGDVGPFSMAITCNDVAANDLCSNAEAISCGDTVAGSTTFATDDIGVAPDCDTPTTAPGVWYVYTDTTGLVTDITLTTCDDADYDTKISVYTGDCGAPPLTCVAGNDDDADCTGFTSTVEFQSDGASTYYILVHGFNTATGNFNLTMDCVPVPPDNDLIANAIDLDEVGCPFTDPDVAMPAATLEAGNPTDCDISGANGVWYKFTPLGDGFITGTVASPAGFTSVTFYTADDESATEGDLTRVDWFENQCLPSDFGRIPFVANQTYYCFVVNSGGRSDIVFSECETLSTADNTIEGFSFYPNPADETINLASVELIETVEVYNLLGQKVMSQEVNTTSTQIDVTTLSQGAYLMKVSVNGQVGTYKIIKK